MARGEFPREGTSFNREQPPFPVLQPTSFSASNLSRLRTLSCFVILQTTFKSLARRLLSFSFLSIPQKPKLRKHTLGITSGAKTPSSGSLHRTEPLQKNDLSLFHYLEGTLVRADTRPAATRKQCVPRRTVSSYPRQNLKPRQLEPHAVQLPDNTDWHSFANLI